MRNKISSMARTVISGNVIASQSNRVGRKGQNVRKAVYIRVREASICAISGSGTFNPKNRS